MTSTILLVHFSIATNHITPLKDPILGESTLHPPKIVVPKIEILHLVFLGRCGHHILDYFCSFQVYCFNCQLKLVYFERNSNKHIWTWIYEIYLCWKNTRHIVWKIANILQNQGYGWRFVMNFLVVSDIDVHQLNFLKIKSL